MGNVYSVDDVWDFRVRGLSSRIECACRYHSDRAMRIFSFQLGL